MYPGIATAAITRETATTIINSIDVKPRSVLFVPSHSQLSAFLIKRISFMPKVKVIVCGGAINLRGGFGTALIRLSRSTKRTSHKLFIELWQQLGYSSSRSGAGSCLLLETYLL